MPSWLNKVHITQSGRHYVQLCHYVCSPGVTIRISLSNSIIPNTILHLPTWIPPFWLIYRPVGIYIHIIIYMPYSMDLIQCSVILNIVCWANTCLDQYNIVLIGLFGNLNELVNTISPAMLIYAIWGIATAYSWAWGCNINCWLFLEPFKEVSTVYPSSWWSG